MLIKTDERYKISLSGQTGYDGWVDKYLSDSPDSGRTAIDKIYTSSLKRSYVEAALLATQDYEKISELLEIPPSTVEFFSKIFFDVSNLDRLDKLELVTNTKDKADRNLKIWSMSFGLDFLAWRLGKAVVISPVEGLTQLFNDCLFKSKEAIFNNNNSASSKESAKWVKLSIDIARLLKVWLVDSSAAMKDLEIALKSVVPDFKSIEDLDD